MLEIQEVPVHPFDTEALACVVTGLDYDAIDADEAIIEAKLIEKFNCDLSAFSTIIGRLLPLIQVGESPITGKTYKGFGNNNMWLVKTEI